MRSALLAKIKAKMLNEWSDRKNRIFKFYRSLYTEQHQLTSTTSENRYPVLFEESRKALKTFDAENISLLSFGCSTGEECFTLRTYFPHSRIIGTDINQQNLKMAQKRNADSLIQFVHSTERNIRDKGPYHAIFCLSVLCRWEDTKDLENCEKIYHFEKFRSTVEMLSNALLPGGLLVIFNSNFAFEETDVFVNHKYEIVPTPAIVDSGFVYKFDRNNNRRRDIHTSCLYRKAI